MSKGIYFAGKWHEIKKCILDCMFYDSNLYLCKLLNKDHEGYNIILPNCLLPDWDLVRDHGPDEVPKISKERPTLIVITRKHHNTRHHYRSLESVGDSDIIFRGQWVKKDDKIVSWRYIL